MAVHIDLVAQTVTCSVHDLLPELAQRSLGTPGEGLARLSVGAELHRLVQGERTAEDPHYRSEVAVDATMDIDGWSLRVLGRADGITVDQEGTPVLEEIKTLHFRSELYRPFSRDRIERFRWQARIYACCLFPEGGASIRLLLVDLGGEERREEAVPWSPAEVRAYLRARLHALIAVERQRERVRAIWRSAAEELPFPFDTVRPVQGEAMEAVADALAAGRHLLLAAPTGVGKTAAVLHPAVRLALSSGRRVAFLTAKTMQQHLATDTLRRMQRGGWSSIQIRAKAKMCANREVICLEDTCLHAREYGTKLREREVLETVRQSDLHIDPDRVFAVADAAEVCPFETSLELVSGCTAVVCDYNYVFDPAISLFGLAAEGALEDTFLVVDEAHNLVDRAREYYSPRLARSRVEEARRLLQPYRQRLCRDLDEVLGALSAHILEQVTGVLGSRTGVEHLAADPGPLADTRLALDALIPAYFTFKRNEELWLAHDPVVDVLLSLARLVDLLEDAGPELVPLAERDQRGDEPEALRVFCLDASRFTGPILDRSAGCVAMSATLEPFDFYRELLGFDTDRTDTLSLPSPFPAENRLVVAVNEVDTSYRRRSSQYGRIAELITELAPEGRNVLVLFPSYAFLNEVANRLTCPGHRIEVQRGGDSDRMRRDMLRLLRSNHEPVLLLAVLGGVFAEGVDYPGDMLSEVIVVSPALPQVGPERELLKRYFQERYESGFAYAYLIPGMTRVVQAAGRLIRSADDRGVIVLMCRRFLSAPYISFLPSDWTGDEPASLRVADPAAVVAAFFAEPPVAP